MISVANSSIVMSWASRTTGTMRPRGVAAAMPRLMWSRKTIWSVASSHAALMMGVRPIARHTALHHTVSGETRRPLKRRSARSRLTSSIVGVTSQVRKAVTRAFVSKDSFTAFAVTLRTPRTGTLRVWPSGSVGAPPRRRRDITDRLASSASPGQAPPSPAAAAP